MGKLTDLATAAAAVPDGALLGLGGNTLNRAPMAAVMELARQKKRGLRLVKTAGGMDVDLLCFAGCVQSVDAGFISYETEYGLCGHYRKAVQSGSVTAHEHACYTVISALRAASYGIPFMPVRGLKVSDLVAANDYFSAVTDPFTGETLNAVRALRPDVSIVHAQIADEKGNALITGPQYDDILLSRASKTVIVTAERMVGDAYFASGDVKADIPHFLVSAVVYAPRGAQPCACHGCYSPGDDGIRSFLSLQNGAELAEWLQRRA
ncbi:MAG: CoA transferase subunit A [Eubacteriales bacterium]|nr:CoA transferase subunit A [Eubacteriales bacterium]MDD3214039.1 CoA transferase subunit A [Eubacteriales bacterium]